LCYLFFAAFSASFLQTPMVTRVLLLVAVPLNAVAELQNGKMQCLSFAAMTTLIAVTTLSIKEYTLTHLNFNHSLFR
jgi:hypothetical protein